MSESITITFNAQDCACLPGVLESRIREVEQHMRICGDRYRPEDKGYTETFLAQMRGCLAAVSSARAAWVKGKSDE